MSILLACAGTAAYVLIGVRTAIVAHKVSLRAGVSFSVVDSVLFGAAWPVLMLVVGVGVCLSGNSGIYDSSRKMIER